MIVIIPHIQYHLGWCISEKQAELLPKYVCERFNIDTRIKVPFLKSQAPGPVIYIHDSLLQHHMEETTRPISLTRRLRFREILLCLGHAAAK